MLLSALLIWSLFVGLTGVAGWQDMLTHGPTDPDSVMRLAQIKDLLAGQSFFDATQYRMNAPFGLEMHWSRLIDVPIAALVLLGNALLGAEYGVPFALTVWPTIVLLAVLLTLAILAREVGGTRAVLPCMVFTLACPRIAAFMPGQIDHHNVQILLCLAVATCVVTSRRVPQMAGAAGVIVPLSLSVGMETAVYALICCAWFPCLWILKGHEAAEQMASFSISLFCTTGLLMAGLLIPVSGFSAQCDVLSFAYAPALMAGALGLYVLAKTVGPSGRRPVRLAAISALAAICILSIASVAPDCLKGPYASLATDLRPIWFDHIPETWNLVRVWHEDVHTALVLYPYFASAIACGGWAVWTLSRRSAREMDGLIFVLVMLTAGAALGVFQVRALTGAAFLAIPIFAVFAACVHELITVKARTPGVLAVWLLAWMMGTNAPWLAVARLVAAEPSSHYASNGCRLAEGLATLNNSPPGVVINSFVVGPWIAAFSEHGAVSGPYHRNEGGISSAHRILTAEPEAARRLIASRGGRYLAWCKDDRLFEANSIGLVATIESGLVPDWLEPLGIHTHEGLRLYEVRRSKVPTDAYSAATERPVGQDTPVPPKPQ
ncbi:MAG: hypothetical protein AAGF81_20605, partial [Pseudomonadota bacterium]